MLSVVPAWTSPSATCMHVTGVEKKRHFLAHLWVWWGNAAEVSDEAAGQVAARGSAGVRRRAAGRESDAAAMRRRGGRARKSALRRSAGARRACWPTHPQVPDLDDSVCAGGVELRVVGLDKGSARGGMGVDDTDRLAGLNMEVRLPHLQRKRNSYPRIEYVDLALRTSK